MKTNKKLLSALSIVCAFAIIFGGVFAFFSDSSILNETTKVGKVDISVTGDLYHSNALNNLNPGDNDPDVPEDYRSGTDHELSFEINNLGNKSVITRTIIEISGVKNDVVLTESELINIILSEKQNVATLTTQDNIALSDTDKYDTVFPLEPVGYDNNKLTYIIGGSASNNMNYVLNGSGEFAETETGIDTNKTSLIQTFDIGLNKDTSSETFEGATITFKIIVQAMQYRSTGDAEWNNIFEKSYTTEGSPETNRDELAPNSSWYKGTRSRSSIETITLMTNYVPDGTEKETWNADVDNSGDIKAYILEDEKTLILTETNSNKIKANKDSSYVFADIEQKDYFTSLKTINNLNLLNTYKATDMSCMFRNAVSLTTLDVSEFNTSNVTSFLRLFNNCVSLTELDVSMWDTSNVTNMCATFAGSSGIDNPEMNITSWGDLSSWDTSNVTTMQAMFQHNKLMTSFDFLENWNLSKCTRTDYMFMECDSLTEINLSQWDVSKVFTMYHMFADCINMVNYNFEGWNTEKLQSIDGMFNDNTSLIEIDVSDFDTALVVRFCQAFENCKSLTTIIGLENWDTTKGFNYSEMFSGCKSLTELDLSSWDTSEMAYVHTFFANCTNLKTIYVSDKWSTEGLVDTTTATNGKPIGTLDDVFKNCTSLVGGAGTTYDPNFIKDEYLHVDTIENPGYLTLK